MFTEYNSYFNSVVKDAITDLKRNGRSFVFCMEQVDAIKKEYKEEFDVIEDEGYFILVGKKLQKKETRGRKKNDENKKL